VACGADRGGSGTGANYEPERVATQAPPESAAFCGGDCGIAFFGDRGEFHGVIDGILFGRSSLGLAGAVILHVIEDGFQIGDGNWCGGSVGEFLLV
jgi:hypothetical protein